MVHVATPPDPNIRAPRMKCPPGAVDTHVHMLGPQTQFPVIKDTPYLTGDALPETCLAMHRALGVEHAVLVSPGAYGRSYDYMLHVLDIMGGALRGVIVPPPELTHAEMDLLDDAGVRGIRFASDAAGKHVAHIEPELARQVFEWGWHVEFVPGHGDFEAHVSRLLELPNDIVVDHFGRFPAAAGTDQTALRRLLEMIDTGRVWVKLSGPMYVSALEFPYADVLPLANVLARHAPERLLWGTDWPHLNMGERRMPNDADLLDLMLEWVPDEPVRERILTENPHHLYRF
jgi:2-pyrone-4,6-dicarboxylate lactonase